ncbi:hypothetical protein WJX72_009646 [[Myrmecia] bisecta]|uniref:Protein kinase domain-containing protein n=1 Tax=[Myrmecia] bisecta TaxID=41462 RepID=A0AAW1R8W1_9CHLO
MKEAILFICKPNSAAWEYQERILFEAYQDLRQSVDQLCKDEQWAPKRLRLHNGAAVLSPVHLPGDNPVRLDLHVVDQLGPAAFGQLDASGQGALAPINCEHAVIDALFAPFTEDNVGYGLPEYVGKRLNFEVITGRNVEDTSIMIEDKKRDFMLHLFKKLLVGGEDKASRRDMPTACSELESKHKGANAAVYGGLGYIVLIATAGDMCAVFAKGLAKDTQMVSIIEAFEMRSQGGRRKVVELFINITRWIRTVDTLKLLPPPPPAPLAIPFCRPLPYPGIHADVELTLHFQYVEKSFFVPNERLPELLEVYALLDQLQMPGAVKCEGLQVNGEAVALSGFVHRDIRLENVVQLFDEWILIDWELAGRADQRVWWHGKVLPEPVRNGHAPYTVQTELWQVGRLIQMQLVASDGARQFAQRLVAGDYVSAARAAEETWAVTSS